MHFLAKMMVPSQLVHDTCWRYSAEQLLMLARQGLHLSSSTTRCHVIRVLENKHASTEIINYFILIILIKTLFYELKKANEQQRC